jgi:thiol-disulfide isomerase/thioredoxin
LLSLQVEIGQCGGGSIPANWWNLNKAVQVHSNEEFEKLINGDWKHKHVFIDFYMQHCPWCYYIVEDLNRLVDDMNDWYGEENVVIVKIDGPKVRELAYRYQI